LVRIAGDLEARNHRISTYIGVINIKETILFIFCTLLIVLSYVGLSFSTIPVQTTICSYDSKETVETAKVFQNPLTPAMKPVAACLRGDDRITVAASFPVYVAAIFTFAGWWMLVLYGGLGMTAVPLGLANDFRNRPYPMTEEVFTNKKNDLS
jgi:LMBR1 domain-containing protein 1